MRRSRGFDMHCRHCYKPLTHVFLDLGLAPFSNAYLSKEDLQKTEALYPLKLFVCDQCWLVQTEDFAKADDLFQADYAYFSSTSTSWLAHSKSYTDMITKRLDLNKDSFAIELASNDGYLLKNFVEDRIPCLGIEPTKDTANTARKLGIDVLEEFFGEDIASGVPKADLIIGNNVYAHVPDINDFTKGMKVALKPSGTITLEFPHLLELINHNQFDTVYHEHFSYLSLGAVNRIFAAVGLRIYDVETIPTHGGSLRVYGCHDNAAQKVESAVTKMLTKEKEFGLENIQTYLSFQAKADKVKNDFIAYLKKVKAEGKKIAGYGAAAKGNTLMNYAGIKADMIDFVSDAAPSKQNKFLPGSHIPVLPPSAIDAHKPDIIVIFPWNIADEVKTQLAHVKAWNAKFVTAVPALKESVA